MTTTLETPLPAPRDNPLYAGLSEKSRLWITATAALVAVVNLAFAWIFAFEAKNSLAVTVDEFKPYTAWLTEARTANLTAEAKYDIAARTLHLVALSKTIANKQGIVLACFGAAFALSALGFGLFLLGSDGAFKVIADAPNKASVAITGTAPGLLCFALAAWLVVTGVKREARIELPPLLNQYSVTIPRTSPSPCQHEHLVTGECIDPQPLNRK